MSRGMESPSLLNLCHDVLLSSMKTLTPELLRRIIKEEVENVKKELKEAAKKPATEHLDERAIIGDFIRNVILHG